MRVVFRVDGSATIGGGHVARCLALACALRQRGSAVTFLSRDLPGNLVGLIREQGFSAIVLPSVGGSLGETADPWLGVPTKRDAQESCRALGPDVYDWLVVDSYGIDAAWERTLASNAGRILAIDDLPSRDHNCVALVDQNLHEPDVGELYRSRVPDDCRLLLGPRFALLDERFAASRRSRVSERVEKVVVFMGSADPDNMTSKVIEAITPVTVPLGISVHVIIGSPNRHRDSLLDKYGHTDALNLHCGVTNMASHLRDADLAVGAGGTSTWERCCLGVPSVILSIADNQVAIARNVDRAGAAHYVGDAGSTGSEVIAHALERMILDCSLRAEMAQRAQALCDGLGADRVSIAMEQMVEAR